MVTVNKETGGGKNPVLAVAKYLDASSRKGGEIGGRRSHSWRKKAA